MVFRRAQRAESFGSMATHSSASGHPSPTAANVTKAFPSLFSGPPPFRPHSPTSASSPTYSAFKESNIPQPRNLPYLPLLADRPFSDPARVLSFDGRDPRSSPRHLASQPQAPDPPIVRSNGSPLASVQGSRGDSSRSSPSSLTSSTVFGSGTATPTSLTSWSLDQRAQRTLPPLSALLGARDDLVVDGSPATAQPKPYLRPTFSSSTLSGEFSRFMSWFMVIRACPCMPARCISQNLYESLPTTLKHCA